MTTIGRNQAKKAELIFMNARNITGHTLDNGFAGQGMPDNRDSRDYLFKQWTGLRFATLTHENDNQYKLRITSSEWYNFQADT